MKNQQKQQGGTGATEFGANAFGGMNNQHALGGHNNAIAVNQQSGGRRRKRNGRRTKSRGGNYQLNELLVPAALMIANHKYANRSARRHTGSRKYSGSSRNRTLSRRR